MSTNTRSGTEFQPKSTSSRKYRLSAALAFCRRGAPPSGDRILDGNGSVAVGEPETLTKLDKW
jgi:hypothetical protein